MKRSLPPSSGTMNPKPFSSLNHLTVPVATTCSPPPPLKKQLLLSPVWYDRIQPSGALRTLSAFTVFSYYTICEGSSIICSDSARWGHGPHFAGAKGVFEYGAVSERRQGRFCQAVGPRQRGRIRGGGVKSGRRSNSRAVRVLAGRLGTERLWAEKPLCGRAQLAVELSGDESSEV